MKDTASLFSKILDIIISPTNTGVLAAFTFASFMIFTLNFLPEKIIERINLMSFLEKYSFISLIAFIILGALLTGQLILIFLKRKERKQQEENLKKVHEELFQDSDALGYLLLLYLDHPNAVPLPLLNQKVKILSQYGMIVQATNQWLTDPVNPHLPFILQSFVEQRIREDIEKGNINIDDFLK